MTLSGNSVCQWCGEPARHTREVVPEQLHPRTKEIVKKGIYADVCDAHNAMFNREEQRRELEKSIRRLEQAERRGRPFNPDTLAERRAQLEALK
jgi:hypothetical protein